MMNECHMWLLHVLVFIICTERVTSEGITWIMLLALKINRTRCLKYSISIFRSEWLLCFLFFRCTHISFASSLQRTEVVQFNAPPEVCARIHVLFNIYMCFLWIGQSQQSYPSAGPQFCSASSAVSLFYTCLRLRAVSTKPLQPTLGLVSKSITEHPQRWPFHRMKTYVIRFQVAQMGMDRLCYLCESHIAYTVCRLHVELLAVTWSSLWDCCGKYVK